MRRGEAARTHHLGRHVLGRPHKLLELAARVAAVARRRPADQLGGAEVDELGAAVGRCELDIQIRRSIFNALPTSPRVSVRDRGRRGGWTPEMGTRLRR